jgi:molybdate transport system substrate-binding protein
MKLTALVALFAALPVFAQDVHVFTSNGPRAAMEKIYPASEKTVGKKVSSEYNTTTALRKKAEAGDAFDVAVLTNDAIDGLIKSGKIAADSKMDFARAGVGVGYRKGSPKPDVSTDEALKKSLLAAKSITYNEVGASRAFIEQTFAKLGIADQMKAKTVLEPASGQSQIDVGQGKVELVLSLVPEIPPYENVLLAGAFPADLQNYITFSVGVSAKAGDPKAARALAKFIGDPARAGVLKANNLEPVR